MAKLLVDLHLGQIHVEGEEEFVERVYSDIRDVLVEKIGSLRSTSDESEEVDEAGGEPKQKSSRKVGKRTGPSCASRILALQGEGLFNQLRTAKEVGDKLREKGTAYEAKRVAGALLSLTSAGKLRRLQEGGVWKYQNP